MIGADLLHYLLKRGNFILGEAADPAWRTLRIPGRRTPDKDRISRHYYDVAVITATEVGRSALAHIDLLEAVRNHNLVAFRQAWKRFAEAAPGSVRLVPQAELRKVI